MLIARKHPCGLAVITGWAFLFQFTIMFKLTFQVATIHIDLTLVDKLQMYCFSHCDNSQLANLADFQIDTCKEIQHFIEVHCNT